MLNFEEQMKQFIENALREDIGDGDHSSLSCIPPGMKGRGLLKIKEAGVLAGMRVAEEIFRFLEPGAGFFPLKKDGEIMFAENGAYEFEGGVHTILKCERLVLNCMQRMSGIASLTRQYVDLLKPFHTRVLDTRKTTPNFRILEKEAVRIGGGYNHRMGLYDMIMLKDNHIDYSGGLENAIENAYSYVQTKKPGLKIEVETRNLEEVKRAVATGKVDRIMFDNFEPSRIVEAMQIVQNRCETEASGGINLFNVIDYARTGVDFVSVGAIIHHAVSLDLSLKASPI